MSTPVWRYQHEISSLRKFHAPILRTAVYSGEGLYVLRSLAALISCNATDCDSPL